MKKWRVGTLSMGITLVLLGVVLFISQWKGQQTFDAFITWWPIVFVLLGLEIVLYLSFSKKENSIISYDVMSILFVGVLCIGCLGFTMLASVGLMGEVRSMIGAIDETKDLPAVKETVAEGVKKVIVQSQDQTVKVDKSQERSLQVFGTYRSRTNLGEAIQPLEKEQFIAVRTVGDTMYVQVKRLPQRRGFDSYYPWMTVTVVLPQDVQTEVRGANNQMIE
ncbi:LiaF transmembrane domain-containing protein [Paenibacillus radicis (ex Xue et al. 2023)]|uniref:LiaF transmembrane domain-containing protein n=1 Tax=Paenibacillus radicis (ex Xue et al. 2023) TaxID=2972489 RepID=A0ABT1YIM2_9BACL|nr:hypothetical protein [Paenibacillus radicis (ex Xue et al. 2023)]MCR8632279.1 hypothetical protein [Paenibacillus radicis (ex Xue et al. 2023)]